MLVIMSPKKILVNVVVVLALVAVALTVPYLMGSGDAVDGVSNPPVVLVCERVDVNQAAVTDYPYTWQLYETKDGQVVTTWEQIYAAYQANAGALVVSDNLRIMPAGLVYVGDAVADFIGWARYQGRSVVVRL